MCNGRTTSLSGEGIQIAVNPYASQSITGYNSSPPPDDGSQTSANKVEWQKHKSKLADPVKTLAEAINTQSVAAFNSLALEDAFISTTSATVAEADSHGLYVQLATGNIYYPDPSLFENGWHHTVYNGSTGVVSLQATATSYWLVDGALASEALLLPGRSAKPMNTATVWIPWGLDATATVRAGETLQTQYTFLTTCVTATNTIPFDTSIPVATEGTEVFDVDITPNTAGNLIEVEAMVFCAPHSNTSIQAAIFHGTASAAVSVGTRSNVATDHLGGIPVRYWATATEGAQTFAVRVGANTGNHTINGTSGVAAFGGTLRSFIKVTEYKV